MTDLERHIAACLARHRFDTEWIRAGQLASVAARVRFPLPKHRAAPCPEGWGR